MGTDLHVMTTDLDGNTMEAEFALFSWSKDETVKYITNVSLHDQLNGLKCSESTKIIEQVSGIYNNKVSFEDDIKESLEKMLKWSKEYPSAKWQVY